jgi:hypothetical protein
MEELKCLGVSTSALALSFALAPFSAFASSPQQVTTTPVTEQLQVVPVAAESGTVTTMGVKKSVFVFALKYGGKLLEEFLEYLGKKEYADIVKENRLSIANFLEETELVLEKNLTAFLIFECGIPQGAARVISQSIMWFAF